MLVSDVSAALKRHDPAWQPWQRPAGLSSDLLEIAQHMGIDADDVALLWLERAAIRIESGQGRREAERGALEDCKRMVK